MGLSVTVLGCSGSYPGPGSACSGYLVQGAGATVWLDAGSGTLANLQRHVGLHDVDAVVLSHEHPDHWSDIEGYRVAIAYVAERQGVPLYAPAALRSLVSTDFEPHLVWHPVRDGSQALVGGLRLTFSGTDHTEHTVAVRIDGDGRSFGYSADTGPLWSLEALGHGLDLALCEATWLSDREVEGAKHLSARQAGATARAAGAVRLVLTHLWPVVDPEEARAEASEAFGGPVEVARVGAAFEV